MPQTREDPASDPIRIAVSACLLGETVRYDGGHRHDRYLTGILARFCELVPVCPEVEVGLSVPRPVLRLVREGDEVRVIMPETGRDLTRRMRSYAEDRVAELIEKDVSGCILKSKSPSCGLRARTSTPEGRPAKSASGLFAHMLRKRLPNLPVIEEGPLHDPRLRENWIERVFAYRRLRQFWSSQWKLDDLMAFHIAHKYLLLSHSPKAYQDMGHMLAGSESTPSPEVRRSYESEFSRTLARPATPTRHARVLRRILAVFQKDVDGVSRRELLERIEDYHQGLAPLVVPLALISHYVRLLEIVPLYDQVYLNPHPKELALRYHV